MTSPKRPVNITSIIQSTELSMPRDLASRATQTSSAMLSAMMHTTMAIITPMPRPQLPQAAQAAASSFGRRGRCASATPYRHRRFTTARVRLLSLYISGVLSVLGIGLLSLVLRERLTGNGAGAGHVPGGARLRRRHDMSIANSCQGRVSRPLTAHARGAAGPKRRGCGGAMTRAAARSVFGLMDAKTFGRLTGGERRAT